MKKIGTVWMLSWVISWCYATDEIPARVITVIDGNTLEVITSGNVRYKIVMVDIDCPELNQEFGEEAKLHAEKLMLDKDILVQFQGKDRSGNYIAIIFVNDLDPRIDLLNRGLAWVHEKGAPIGLKDLEERARKSNVGLWEQVNPTPPWIFRRQQSMMTVKGS